MRSIVPSVSLSNHPSKLCINRMDRPSQEWFASLEWHPKIVVPQETRRPARRGETAQTRPSVYALAAPEDSAGGSW